MISGIIVIIVIQDLIHSGVRWSVQNVGSFAHAVNPKNILIIHLNAK